MTDGDIETAAVDLAYRVFPGAEVIMTRRPCKLCGAEIIFIKGPKNNIMVFDAKPITRWFLDPKTNTARSFPTHEPHWATCPDAEEFRQKKAAPPGGGDAAPETGS